ncbi:MAG: hypothetical protein E8D52_05260 [Nitrospira sp.]|nr:MAG: hypothetical protein E8D52_05260 [Nitrospira sp.]
MKNKNDLTDFSLNKSLVIMQKLDQNFLGAIALCLLLASCGPGPQAGGGIGGTGQIASVVSGAITGFGSVFVSGYEYETGSTSMMVDGKSGSLTDLKKGMLVRVNATVTERYDTHDVLQRAANTLLYEDTVEGVVQSVASDGSSLVDLGQTVAITTSTVVDASIPGRNVLSLMPGRDLVEVSGFVTGDGAIMGTFIELRTLDMNTQVPDYEVKGFIKNHNAAQKTFEIGALTIEYSDARLNDMPGQISGDDWNGLLVDATGDQVSSGDPGSSGVRMKANLVWPETLGSKDSENAKVEAFVTHVRDLSDFSMGIVRVQTSPGTVFEGGTPSDVQVGIRLVVNGPLVDGVVNATKVKFEREEEDHAEPTMVNSTGARLPCGDSTVPVC